jgi:trk system potassium uptake protein TrkH
VGAGWFDAVVHCLAAVSTGGFSTRDKSHAAFSTPIQLVITGLTLIAAIPLHLYWISNRKKFWNLLNDVQTRTLLLCVVTTTLALFGLMLAGGTFTWPQALRHAALNACSAQTTAGFSTIDISDMDAGAKLVMICSMAIGGGAGSTAGGCKLIRLLIVLYTLKRLLFWTALPKDAVRVSAIGGRRLEADEREAAFCIVAFYALTVLGSWLPFVVAGLDPLDSLFEVVSATGTVGLSCGISSAELPDFLKAVLCIDMLMGRLEFIALLILVYPRTWFGRRMHTS